MVEESSLDGVPAVAAQEAAQDPVTAGISAPATSTVATSTAATSTAATSTAAAPVPAAAGTAAAPAAPTGQQQEQPPLYYPHLEAWVRQYLAPMWRRHNLDGRNLTWCPMWWKHPEAQIRLDALWRAWEVLRQDAGLGMSVWLRDHAGPHMGVLMNPDGPFKGCTPDKGHQPKAVGLALEAPPLGLFQPLPEGMPALSPELPEHDGDAPLSAGAIATRELAKLMEQVAAAAASPKNGRSPDIPQQQATGADASGEEPDGPATLTLPAVAAPVPGPSRWPSSEPAREPSRWWKRA
ncbi:DUF4913 domain-containing protein [Kineococcus xinjiangensis]|uniref:DUF4913 domain-containing protein n=1 Tax=Kineococcus xinjiangensis TaxID=512762 RepID=UPI001B80A532|nr:DUF4913 domain-containing protein [Kineococcus xinjiangensis]